MPIRPARSIVLALLACCSFAAVAQPGAQLPQGVATRPTLNDADRQAVASWVAGHAEALRTGDAAAVSGARTALLDALTRETSVAFRLEVNTALSGALTALARGSDETRAFNALQVAGALATDGGAELLRTALTSNRPTVRYGGALGSRILFQQVIAGRSPLQQDAVTAQVNALGGALEREADPVVAEGIMTAMAVQFAPPVRAAALRRMDDAMVARLGSLHASGEVDPAWTRPLVRAVDSSRRLLLDQQVAGQRDEAFARAATTLAAHGLAFGSSMLDGASAAERDAVADLLKASEVTLLLTSAQLGARDAGNEQPIAQALERNNAAAARQAIDRWIGQNGVLFRAPFNLPAGSLRR